MKKIFMIIQLKIVAQVGQVACQILINSKGLNLNTQRRFNLLMPSFKGRNNI